MCKFNKVLSNIDERKKVTIVGAGNWGSAIACVVGKTVLSHAELFHPRVRIWCRDSKREGEMSTCDAINNLHENVKYLPGRRLPSNVVATSDLIAACRDAHVLVFAMPHQGVKSVCEQLAGQLRKDAIGISLVKGVSKDEDDGCLKLISEEMSDCLDIDVAVLMGANLAAEVADEKFCEATIGCRRPKEDGEVLKKLFDTPNFRINVVADAHTVELSGALKNIVACAAGFADGLSCPYNIKSAIIRLGLFETHNFVSHFYPGSRIHPLFESCGVADLITTCFGGRNRKVCEAFVGANKPMSQVEKELLNGQSAQGPPTAADVFDILCDHDLHDQFPLFSVVHQICSGYEEPKSLLNCLRNHPAHA